MAHGKHEDVKVIKKRRISTFLVLFLIKQHDNRRSIFIGNLPFDVSDDDVWQVFEECGTIESKN